MKKIRAFYSGLSLYHKLLLGYLLPMLTGILLVVLLVYPITARRYQTTLMQNLSLACDRASELLRGELGRMDEDLQRAVLSPSLRRELENAAYLRRKDLGQEYRDYYRFREILTAIRPPDDTNRLSLYVSGRLSYAHNRIQFLPRYEFEEMGDYTANYYLLREGGVITRIDRENSIYNPSNEYEALTRYRMVLSDNLVPMTVVRSSVRLERLQQLMSGISMLSEGITIVLDDEGRILFASDDSIDADHQALLVKAWQEHGEMTGLSRVTIPRENYYVRVTSLPGYGMRLLSFIPRHVVTSQQMLLGLIFFLMAALLGVICALVSAYLSAGFTRRLQSINTRIAQIRREPLPLAAEAEDGYETGSLRNAAAATPAKTPGPSAHEAAPEAVPVTAGLSAPEATPATTPGPSAHDHPGGDEIDWLGERFEELSGELDEMMRRQYQMGRSVQRAELSALQAQINPHFLYNTLDLINWIAQDYGSPEIADITHALSRFYRLTLNRGSNILTIREELEHVSSFVAIENYHFEGAIALKVQVPEEMMELACPNIILQPFVENSIMHGIAEHPEMTECSITIRGERDEGDIVFTVEDDGLGMTPEQIRGALAEGSDTVQSGYGVRNVNRRLKLYYGPGYGVDFDGTTSAGTVVHVRIPALTPAEHRARISE